MELHLDANDIAGSLSPIWYAEDGAIVAAATLAIRGPRGWVGGFGVAPPHRGRGIATELLDCVIGLARGRGIRSLELEVLCENGRAIRTYRRAGFETRRTLESSRWAATRNSSARARLMPVAAFVKRPDRIAPCWQREVASLMRQPGLRAVSLDEHAYAIFRHDQREAQILKVEAPSSAALAALAASIVEIFGLGGVSLFNEPSASPIARYARDLGWQRTFEQYEMVRALT